MAVPVLPKTGLRVGLQNFPRRPTQEFFYKGIFRNGQRDFFHRRPAIKKLDKGFFEKVFVQFLYRTATKKIGRNSRRALSLI